MFIDYAKIRVRAGDGGRGCIAFRREKYVPHGGPSGGDGGDGGNVIIKADKNRNTLLEFRYRKFFRANNGRSGQGSNRKGKRGEDIYLYVPVGTLIRAEDNTLIKDLLSDSEEIVVAKGGRGGRGNAAFASSVNQAPMYAEEGTKGEEKIIILELKLIADVGITGFPNVGKSTLISVISAAKPKVADYPFTTLHPCLGVVKVDEYNSFIAADIPGIIENSHMGAGLGLQFLRHIERTKLLWILIDLSYDINPIKILKLVRHELSSYSRELAEKPYFIVGSKKDIAIAEVENTLSKYCARKKIVYFLISSVKREGMNELIKYTYEYLKGMEVKVSKCVLV